MKPLRIVIGYDGSEDSNQALAWARSVSEGLEGGSELHLVGAMGLIFLPRFPESATVDAVLGEQEEEIRDVLLATREELASAGIDAQIHLRRWFPSEAILTVAKEIEADLVVVGSHDGGWRERLVLGSVSAEVVDRATLPVLVARGGRTPRSPRRVLVGVDGSVHSIRALRVARTLFPGAQLTATGGRHHAEGPREKDLGEAVRAAEIAPDAVRFSSLEGSPAAALLEASRDEEADVIVVGRRGIGTLEKLVLGSVSEKLLQLAPCPVVLVN